MSFRNRACEHCDSHHTTVLSSISRILCSDCGLTTPFVLKPRQQAVLENRVGETNQGLGPKPEE